ncbi:unnamed protein product [Ilex paraguariensis]|uniref:Cytochrome P450 n=1 Tax=Ilex paraguariensis TaxID=185542 RepID=A0ABC8S7H9_9AQUA
MSNVRVVASLPFLASSINGINSINNPFDSGPVFMFSMGNLQIVYMNDPEVVKEISTCTSPDFGKPSYQRNVMGTLLGEGILDSNGAIWAYQRKIIAPQLFMDKVKVPLYFYMKIY